MFRLQVVVLLHFDLPTDWKWGNTPDLVWSPNSVWSKKKTNQKAWSDKKFWINDKWYLTEGRQMGKKTMKDWSSACSALHLTVAEVDISQYYPVVWGHKVLGSSWTRVFVCSYKSNITKYWIKSQCTKTKVTQQLIGGSFSLTFETDFK